MAEPLLLSIDLGTSSVKVMAATATGRTEATGVAEFSILHPQPGHAEQDPAQWWAAVVEATRQVTSRIDTAAVVAIGLSGQMHGTVLLDDDDAPLGNAIIWPDQRSARQVEEITELIGAAGADPHYRQPGRDRISGSDYPLAAGRRAGALGQDGQGLDAEGLSALANDRRFCHRSQ